MRLAFTFLFIVLLGLSTSVLMQARSVYIGYKSRGVLPGKILPNGVKYFGGGIISDANADQVYDIAEVSRGRTRMLWLEVSTGSDKKGVTGWRVKDVLIFPKWTGKEYLFFSFDPSIYCRRDGQDVENLVAAGQIVRKRGVFVVRQAWLANVSTEKFDKIPTSRLKCEYSEP